MNKARTDNSRLDEKIYIREQVCKDGYTILDCFHGEGRIWGDIEKRKDIKVIGIEKERGKGFGALYGEAEKMLPALNLSNYNIIDFDAWGSPYQSIKAMFRNHTRMPGTCCIYTFIQTGMGRAQKELLKIIGITEQMYTKVPSIYSNMAFDAFKEFLRKNGIKTIKNWHYEDGPSIKTMVIFLLRNNKNCDILEIIP
jgi:hypothetical protein